MEEGKGKLAVSRGVTNQPGGIQPALEWAEAVRALEGDEERDGGAPGLGPES